MIESHVHISEVVFLNYICFYFIFIIIYMRKGREVRCYEYYHYNMFIFLKYFLLHYDFTKHYYYK